MLQPLGELKVEHIILLTAFLCACGYLFIELVMKRKDEEEE